MIDLINPYSKAGKPYLHTRKIKLYIIINCLKTKDGKSKPDRGKIYPKFSVKETVRLTVKD